LAQELTGEIAGVVGEPIFCTATPVLSLIFELIFSAFVPVTFRFPVFSNVIVPPLISSVAPEDTVMAAPRNDRSNPA
jgi:hypothetical protein